MWGDWLEKGKELASKAQAVAKDLDKQLNESVGLEQPAPPPPAIPVASDDALNDAWDGDDEDFAELDSKEPANVSSSVTPIVTKGGGEEEQGWGGEGDDEIQFDDEEPPKDASEPGEKVDEVVAAVKPVTSSEIEEEVAPVKPVDVPDDIPAASPNVEPAAESATPTKQTPPEEKESEEIMQDGWSGHEADDDIVLNDDDCVGVVEPEVPKTDEEATVPPCPEKPATIAPTIQNVTPPVTEPSAEEEPVLLSPIKPIEATVSPPEMKEEMPSNEELPVVTEPATEEQQDALVTTELATDGEKVEQVLEVKEDVPVMEETTRRENESIEIEQPTAQVDNVPPEAPSSPAAVEFTNEPSPPEFQSEEAQALPANQSELTKQIVDLRNRLQQREEQLFSKTEQMTTMAAMHESEKLELQQKVQSTKEEAKRRIQKAKERVEAMDARLQAAAKNTNSSSEESAKQAEIIAALRSEGEKLAHKQADMEKAVRTAKGEARDLREKLEDETTAKEQALEKIETLQTELANTKEALASARHGESQADILEAEVLKVKEESEMKAAAILSLEQANKELKTQVEDLQEDLEKALKGAAIETEREQKKLRKEHTDVVSDFEAKLRTSEREAAVREDALRHEVGELRKRWQDAVRRSDLLSMDVQNSTGPLLRQLESAERQNRARAAAWAELENSLRTELEENVIANEKLSKERSEWKTKFTRLERAATDRDNELKTTKLSLEDRTLKVKQLEEKLETMTTEGAKMKEEWAEIDRLANEGVSRVRSEMAQTVVELEERHKAQLETLQKELQEKEEKCKQLEAQIEEIIKHQGMLLPPEAQQSPSASSEPKPMKLRKSDAQADILAGALNGLGADDYDDYDDYDDEDEVSFVPNEDSGSYAAFAEYAARMKAQAVELTSLKQRLADSEKAREEMVEELGESRSAKEKLPLFESRVQELTVENREMSLEIQGLQEDIAEVRELYRTQLNVLLEEKTARGEDAVTDGESTDT